PVAPLTRATAKNARQRATRPTPQGKALLSAGALGEAADAQKWQTPSPERQPGSGQRSAAMLRFLWPRPLQFEVGQFRVALGNRNVRGERLPGPVRLRPIAP